MIDCRDIPKALFPHLDAWTIQEPSLSDLDIVRGMQAQIDAGAAWLLEHEETYVFLRRHTPWIGQIHLWNLGTPFGMVRAIRAITDAGLERFHRLEARVPDCRHGSVLARCGWVHEGVFRDCHANRDGSFSDEFGYGVTRWDR